MEEGKEVEKINPHSIKPIMVLKGIPAKYVTKILRRNTLSKLIIV